MWFQVLGPLITATLAIVGLYAWHRQLIAKRHFEVAEQALVAFYGADRAIEAIRSPFGHSGEGKTRPREPAESTAETAERDADFVPFERINSHNQAFVELEKTALVVDVHFGPDIGRLMRQPLTARMQVVMAARSIIRYGKSLPSSTATSPSLEKRLRKWDAVLYATGNKPGDAEVDVEDVDEVTVEMAAAKTKVEAALRPRLAIPGFFQFLFPEVTRREVVALWQRVRPPKRQR